MDCFYLYAYKSLSINLLSSDNFPQIIFFSFFLCIFYMVLTSDIVPLYDERAAVQEDCDPGDSLQRTVATIVGQTIQSKEICF